MTPSATAVGSGVYIEQSLASFRDCRMDANSSTRDGGGVAARYNLGGEALGATVGPVQQIVPLDNGNLRVGGGGKVSQPVDWSTPSLNGPPNPVLAGSIWNFQFWFRDTIGGQNTSNLSNAMHITFCP